MADEGNADTFEYPIGGRTLLFNKVTKAQMIMLNRYVDTQRRKAKEAMDAKDLEAMNSKDLDIVIAIGKKIDDATWTTIESQFTNPDDLEWVQMQIIAGRISEDDLYPLLSNGIKRVEAEDDADPAPAKR